MKKSITVKVRVEIDLDAYRTEYGTSDDFADAAQYAAELLVETAKERLTTVGGWATVDQQVSTWTTDTEARA